MASWALKAETEPAFLMDKGSWFQSRIVLGKNDCCLEVELAYGTTYELVLAERDCFWGFIRCLSGSMATCCFTIIHHG